MDQNKLLLWRKAYVSDDVRGAEDHEGQGAASYLRVISGIVAGGTPPKFWAVGKSSCQKFFVEKCHFEAKKLLYWGNLGSKLKF